LASRRLFGFITWDVSVLVDTIDLVLIKFLCWPVVITTLSFVVILVTCLARSEEKQSNKFVWATFTNRSGWKSDGVAFFTSLVNANYIYGGIDGALHLAEEAKNASTAVPLALLSTITIGLVTAFAFAIAMLYTITDFDAVLKTPTGYVMFVAPSTLLLAHTHSACPSTRSGTRPHVPRLQQLLSSYYSSSQLSSP
jgi:amino acid transporter